MGNDAKVKSHKTNVLVISDDIKYKIWVLYNAFPQFEKDWDSIFPEGIAKITEKKFNEAVLNEKMDYSIIILKKILDNFFLSSKEITVVIENNYVDRTYRDCYYTHFSGKHFEYNRYCKRLLFFVGNQKETIKILKEDVLNEKFCGCLVIKPIKRGAIGRTLLSPRYFFQDKEKGAYIRVSKYYIHYCGISLKVYAFPYSMQDQETLSCAEITILNIMDYYSNGYPDYKYTLPSDIYQVLRNNGFERPLPTTGMSYTMISKILFGFGFFPKLYVANEGYTDEQMRRILSYYVESALPVAVGLKYKAGYNHSIVCIGHGKENVELLTDELYRTFETDNGDQTKSLYIADTAIAHNDFIVMDDNIMPYSSYGFSKEIKTMFSPRNEGLSFDRISSDKSDVESKILCIAVPLYKKMYMDAENARYICIELLKENKISFKKSIDDCKKFGVIGTAESPIVMRLFLASSKTFIHERLKHLPKSHALAQLYKVTYFPRFIWVCELSDVEHYKSHKVLGEIILDATSSVTDIPLESVISFFYPNMIFSRTSDREFSEELLQNIQNCESKHTESGIAIEYAVLKSGDSEQFSDYEMFKGNLTKFPEA